MKNILKNVFLFFFLYNYYFIIKLVSNLMYNNTAIILRRGEQNDLRVRHLVSISGPLKLFPFFFFKI